MLKQDILIRLKISICVKPLQPLAFVISSVKYDFLSILSITESLASRGRRLHDTPAQRQNKSYAPDVHLKVEVSPANNRLSAAFADDTELVLKQGEIRELVVHLNNVGTAPVEEVWLVFGREEELWIGRNDGDITCKYSSLVDVNLKFTRDHSNIEYGSCSLQQLDEVYRSLPNHLGQHPSTWCKHGTFPMSSCGTRRISRPISVIHV